MPALANIVINDGAATPVAHTFTPVTTDGWLAQLAERTGSPLAFPRLSVSVRAPVNGNGIYRLKLNLQVPTVVTVDGVQKVDYTQYVTTEYVLSERATEQQRKDLRVMNVNLNGHATITTVIEKLEPIF